jgi:hypothetical protein
VILTGTFALAFAFAGNDLVNFIGVTLGAYSSYFAYAASGAAADVFTMEALRQNATTPTFVLLVAGGLMVVTLWFSKKARRVIQTSINLSSGSRGAKEQFGSSLMGRSIVRSVLNINKLLQQVLPASLFDFVNKRMEKPVHKRGEVTLPFDHVRASINLVVSSILIASATALKLPLSTTYVTFMVAMGSSFADGAWDRESAVYRITGVLAVVGGWFLTALCAFTLCLGMASLVLWGGKWAVFALMAVIVLVFVKINFFTKEKKDKEFILPQKADKNLIRNIVNNTVSHYFDVVLTIYRQGLEHFQGEDIGAMRKDKRLAADLHEEIAKKRAAYYQIATEDDSDHIDRDARLYYYRVFTNLKEISHGLRSVLGTAYNHIDNNHRVFTGIMKDNLETMMLDLNELTAVMLAYGSTTNDDSAFAPRLDQSTALINSIQSQTMVQIDTENLSLRRTELYLNFLQFSRDIINRFSLIAVLEHELNERAERGHTPA